MFLDLCRATFKRESISVGDIFVLTIEDEKDPFKSKAEEVKIIDIRDGYVQYESLTFKWCSNESNSIFVFRSMYKKKK